MNTSWLHSAWGKFRNHETLLQERLTRTQLGGAYKVWEYLLDHKCGDSSMAGPLLEMLDDEERVGATVYASWFAERAKSVKEAWEKSNSGDPSDHAQAADSISVELS